MFKFSSFFMLATTYFFYFGVHGLAVPFLALFLNHRGFSSIEIGEILAVYTATKIVGPTFWAMFADRTGRYLDTIRFGALCALLGFCFLFWAQGYWSLMFSLAIFSLAWTAILAQLEVMTNASIKRSAKIYARIRLWGSIGFIALAVVGGEVIATFSPEAFTYIGVCVLAGLWLATLGLKQPRLSAKTFTKSGSILNKVLEPGFIYFFIAGLLLQVSFGPYYSFFALYLRDLAYPSYAVGLFMGIGVVAEIIIFLIAGALFKYFSIKSLLVVSIFLTALRWYVTGHFADSVIILTLTQLIHAFSFGLYHAASIQYLQRHFERNQQNRGQAIYIAGVYGVGGALGAYLAGLYWLEGLRAEQSYTMAAAVAIVAGCFALFIRIPNKVEVIG